MRAQYAAGIRKSHAGTWRKGQRDRHAKTKREKAIGHQVKQGPYIKVMTERGYVYEHRLVMSLLLGRTLRRSETVHHVNHDKSDNRPSNLELMTKSKHSQLHGYERDMSRPANATRLKPGEWSRKFEECQNCRRRDSPHAAKGWCRRCYRSRYVD
jgi:hypothetical protein